MTLLCHTGTPPVHHSPLWRVLVQPPFSDGTAALHAVTECAGAAAREGVRCRRVQAGLPVTPAAATTGDEEPREGVKSWQVPGGAEVPLHASASL